MSDTQPAAGATAPEPETFEIGLVLAGAISAGAYTAGVMDFLMEALDAIEDVRAGRDVSYLGQGRKGDNPIFAPPHQVKIKSIAGASAGGMVAAIATATFGAKIDPVAGPHAPAPDHRVNNPLYDSWVRRVGIQAMLTTTDIHTSKPLLSLLNVDDLQAITKEALSFSTQNIRERTYLSKELTLFLCLGNLRGVRYALPLKAESEGSSEHEMSMHADYMTFCYGPPPAPALGSGPDPSKIPPPRLIPGNLTNWDTLGKAALASGAFPIGLSARILERPFNDYTQREWAVDGGGATPIRRAQDGAPVLPCDDPASWQCSSQQMQQLKPLDVNYFPQNKPYSFVSVDGGVFNNEPLELARQHLADGGRNPRRPEEANRAVILIDPFPDMADFDGKYEADKNQDLVSIAKRLLPSLIAQARFKPAELVLASHEKSVVSSRFVILPARYGKHDELQRYGIASGSLGGFGGFLSQEFRHHDYMLGRRNCQRFLDNVFLLPADEAQGLVNPIMANWTDPATRKRFERKQALVEGGPLVTQLPIIPLLGHLGNGSYTQMPPWPSAPKDISMADLRRRVIVRADAVKTKLVQQFKPAFVIRAAIDAAWAWKKADWIEQYILGKIRSDLKKMGITIAEG